MLREQEVSWNKMVSRDSLTYTVSQKQSNQVVPSLEFIIIEEQSKLAKVEPLGKVRQSPKRKSMSLLTTCDTHKKNGSRWLDADKSTKRSKREHTKWKINKQNLKLQMRPQSPHQKILGTLQKYKQSIDAYLDNMPS